LMPNRAELKEHIAPTSIGIQGPNPHRLRVRTVFGVAHKQDTLRVLAIGRYTAYHTPSGFGTIRRGPILSLGGKYLAIILVPSFGKPHPYSAPIAIGF